MQPVQDYIPSKGHVGSVSVSEVQVPLLPDYGHSGVISLPVVIASSTILEV